MTALVVTGWGALTAAGAEPEDMLTALRERRPRAPVDVSALVGDVPGGHGHALVDFDARAHLGRRGAASLDRGTALALVACEQALARSGLAYRERPERVGVAIGTTVGGFRAAMDYTRETLVNDRPYLVSPSLFPSTVINFSAGRVAIRFGLRGVNATVAGGRLAFLEVLRFAQNALRRGHADALLAGAVEEYSAQHAWRTFRTGDGAVPAGEAAVAAVVQRAADAGHPPVAELLGLAVGFAPGGDGWSAALGACARRCLRQADLTPGEVPLLATGELTDTDRAESAAIRDALGPAFRAERVLTGPVLGDCQAASGGLALVGLLARAGGAARIGLQTARTPAGAVGAALWHLPGEPARADPADTP